MGVISKITMTEGIAVVFIDNVPAGIDFMPNLFTLIKEAEINVDMISQTTPRGITNSVSFTVIQSRVADLLKVTKQLETQYPKIRTMVSLGNIKISLYGEDMPTKVGVATEVFEALRELREEILLVTTSDVDISVVLQSAKSDEVYKHLNLKLLEA